MKKTPDKGAALDHVLYEIEMLTHALFVLVNPNVVGHDRNAWIEVFAIHARNLNECFSGAVSGKAYMRPFDFVVWNFPYQFDSQIACRASAQVAHLTYDREVPGEKTPWLIDKMFEPLRKASLRFLEQVVCVESLMSFQRNHERCKALLEFLPRIEFK